MSAKHTPGPWGLTATKRTDGLTTHIVESRGSSGVTVTEIVARVFPGDYEGETEGAANARLIAAAPELLAACERIVKGECTCADGGEGFVCDVCEAKAAIAKAKGT